MPHSKVNRPDKISVDTYLSNDNMLPYYMHAGADKVLAALKRHFHWTTIAQDVRR